MGKKLMYVVLIILGVMIFYVGSNILIATLTEYSPPLDINLTLEGNAKESKVADTLSLLTWNIGYAGLGDKEDFFYEGGKQIIPSAERVAENLNGIASFIEQYAFEVDVCLIQEIDRQSKRSYFNDQVSSLLSRLSDCSVAYAKNYDIVFHPLPLTTFPWKAWGKINSGQASYSRFLPQLTKRLAYPGAFPFFSRIYNLKRCVLYQAFDTQFPGKKLIVFNTHNSAFDDGSMRRQEMEMLKELILSEYEAGNFVVVGGDWNQAPPGFIGPNLGGEKLSPFKLIAIPQDYMPQQWTWAYDSKVPTNRNVTQPYQEGETYTTTLDFFLLSPNIQLLNVKAHDLKFRYSDHQPVEITIQLLQ